MKIEFALSPTSVVITVLGEKGPLKDHPGFSKYGCTFQNGHEATVFAKDSETLGTGTNSLVEATVNGVHKVYATLSAFHGLKGGSAAPEKPSQDARYTGGSQPTPPAQQAAEKPKEAPAAIPPGVTPVTTEPSGAYKNQPMILTATPCAPKLDADGGFVRDNITKQPKWEVRVQGDAIPKGVICKVFGEADKTKPPLQPGKQLLYVSREDNKNKPGQYWYEVSAKPLDGKGSGGAKIDTELSIVCAVASNPTIEPKDWLTRSKELREVYYSLKGGSK